MTRIDIKHEEGFITVKSGDMEIGDMALVITKDIDVDGKGLIIIRSHNSYISLNNPKHTWEGDPMYPKVRVIKQLIVSYTF
jgi:hypothetical protein